MLRTIGLAIALTMVAGVAAARDNTFLRAPEFAPASNNQVAPHNTAGSTTGSVAAPEIDPASGVAGVMLMLGTLAVLRGRRATQL